MRIKTHWTLAVTILAAAVVPVSADMIVVTSDAADGRVSNDGIIKALSDGATFAGTGDGAERRWSVILPFALPEIASAADLTSASLELDLISKSLSGVSGSIDVYGLDYRSTPNILTTDHFSGGTDASNPRLENNLATSSTANGPLSLTDDAELLDYLRDQVDAGADAGDFVFIRLSWDGGVAGITRGYTFGLSNNTDASLRPTLTLNVIPEPGVFGLLGLGGALMLCRRRK